MSGPIRTSIVATLLTITVACISPAAFAFVVYKVDPYCAAPGAFSNIQDAVDAAAANPGTDYVWISTNAEHGGYTNQHIVVADPDGVIIEGGFFDCTDFDPGTDLTLVNGAGNGGGAVFTITGTSHVFLGNLFVLGAQRDGGASGGGIEFDGSGDLTLQTAIISQNSAGYGGGINMKASGGAASLTLLHDTLITNNTAQTSGGGIRIEGDTRLFVLAPQTLIGLNHAPGGYGGGIEVLGPAQADIGSPGYNGGAVIQNNNAQYGGGIAAISINLSDRPVVRLFTTDAQNPVQVSSNHASATGGGVYLKPKTNFLDDNTESILCAYDFRIHDNDAQEGAAIYADTDSALDTIGGHLYGTSVVALNTNPDTYRAVHSCVNPEPPPALGAVPCAANVPCSEFRDNVAADDNAQPTPGSTILVQTQGNLFADRFSMRGNQGAHALRALNDAGLGSSGGLVQLSNCLLADNSMTDELASTDADAGEFEIFGCTLAHNQLGAPYVLLMHGQFDLINSIIDQPGMATVDFTSGSMSASYTLANDTSTLGSGDGIIQGEPTFVNVASGDYHLQPYSLGVDFAPSASGTDLDRLPRTVDLPGESNIYGPLDLGAYETQSGVACAIADTVFCNGFEE